MNLPQIAVDRLAFAYADGTPALREISFSVAAGESLGIVGANGAGKSTLLLHLVGCLLPSGGTLSMEGTQLSRETIPAIRQRVGLVFQQPDDQLFLPTVREDVAFGPRNQGLDEKAVSERVLRALESVASLHLIDRPPYRLSGGEKRAVSIATVLAMQPEVLVLDEPSAGLDPRSRRSVIRLLSGLQHTRIIASHDLDLVLDVCPRVLVLSAGRVAADGPSREILSQASLLAECGLELPLSQQGSRGCCTREDLSGR